MRTKEEKDTLMVALKASNGKFVCNQDNGDLPLLADRDAIGAWETFQLTYIDGNKIALKASNNKYVCNENNGDLPLVANRDAIGAWETFDLIHLNSMKNSQWMGDNWDKLQNKTLKDLCLPGTHDSGTAGLELELAPDASDLIKNLFNYADTDSNASGVREYIRGQAVSQRQTISQQLNSGIRYIDLRVCQIGGIYYICHSLKGQTIESVVTGIQEFLNTNTKEIVVIKVGLKSIQDHTQAYNFLKAILKDTQGKDLSVIADAATLTKSLQEFIDDGTRCILISDKADFLEDTYDSSITTNAGTVTNLINKTKAASGSKLLEAQCFRPTSDQNYALGYLQSEGAIALGPLAAIEGIGYNLTSEIKQIFGGEALPAVPKNLHENAQNSRSIVKDYFQWLNSNTQYHKPQLFICDFFDEIQPYIDLGISISTGQPMPDLSGIQDVAIPALRTDWFTSTIGLAPTLVAAAAMAVGIGASDLGRLLQDNIPGITGEILGGTLKGAGYAIGEIASVIHDVLGLTAEGVNIVLNGIGYAADEIENAFAGLGEDFVDFFEDAGETLNPSNW